MAVRRRSLLSPAGDQIIERNYPAPRSQSAQLRPQSAHACRGEECEHKIRVEDSLPVIAFDDLDFQTRLSGQIARLRCQTRVQLVPERLRPSPGRAQQHPSIAGPEIQ